MIQLLLCIVERVVTITRFIDSYPVKSSQALQTAMANAFCYTISSLDDPHVSVAQRAALYLGTINDSALQVRDSIITWHLQLGI